jgi:hypothetical protein
MRILFLIAVIGLSGAVQAQDEVEVPAADEWYKTQYAPLYDDKPWDKLDEIVSFYAENIHEHGREGGSHNSREWFAEALESWKIEGWIRSELAELNYELLNPNTASFKTKWRDYYTGGNISYECSWYLADFTNGKWLIAEYATINCSDHGL